MAKIKHLKKHYKDLYNFSIKIGKSTHPCLTEDEVGNLTVEAVFVYNTNKVYDIDWRALDKKLKDYSDDIPPGVLDEIYTKNPSKRKFSDNIISINDRHIKTEEYNSKELDWIINHFGDRSNSNFLEVYTKCNVIGWNDYAFWAKAESKKIYLPKSEMDKIMYIQDNSEIFNFKIPEGGGILELEKHTKEETDALAAHLNTIFKESVVQVPSKAKYLKWNSDNGGEWYYGKERNELYYPTMYTIDELLIKEPKEKNIMYTYKDFADGKILLDVRGIYSDEQDNDRYKRTQQVLTDAFPIDKDPLILGIFAKRHDNPIPYLKRHQNNLDAWATARSNPTNLPVVDCFHILTKEECPKSKETCSTESTTPVYNDADCVYNYVDLAEGRIRVNVEDIKEPYEITRLQTLMDKAFPLDKTKVVEYLEEDTIAFCRGITDPDLWMNQFGCHVYLDKLPLVPLNKISLEEQVICAKPQQEIKEKTNKKYYY